MLTETERKVKAFNVGRKLSKEAWWGMSADQAENRCKTLLRESTPEATEDELEYMAVDAMSACLTMND